TFRPSGRRASSYRLVTTRFSKRSRRAMQLGATASIGRLFFSLFMRAPLPSLLLNLYMQLPPKSRAQVRVCGTVDPSVECMGLVHGAALPAEPPPTPEPLWSLLGAAKGVGSRTETIPGRTAKWPLKSSERTSES